MAGWQNTAVSAAVDQDLPRPRRQLLNDDGRIVPRGRAGAKREQHGAPLGEKLRAMCDSPLASSTLTSSFGSPPAAGISTMPRGVVCPSRIRSPTHEAPKGFWVAASVTGVPPVTGTFFSSPFDQNATHCPSGEKTGSADSAPSVPEIGAAASSFISRR